MKITMISNYINHHQIPFSNALFEKIGDNYHFIQTEPMEEECAAFGVPVEWGFTLSELGRACRLSVGAAVAVILK